MKPNFEKGKRREKETEKKSLHAIQLVTLRTTTRMIIMFNSENPRTEEAWEIVGR